ncbi:MAG: acylneuraminate cytidylyltransferase family protein [Patescibacteria group bacterium]
MKDTSNLKILGIVGVRSGSKGVHHKNIKPLAGKPLVGWILDAARESKYINRLVVSTDIEEYAIVARQFGAEVPYLRPKELASDGSPEFEYVKHMIEWLYKNDGYKPDMVVRLLATAPLQSVVDIDACIEELLKDPNAQSAVVIAEARQIPHKALKLINDGSGGKHLVSYFTESGRDVTPIARQNYEKVYFRANVIAFRPEVISSTSSLTGDRVRYHIIPQERAIDIDSPIDFFIAEKLIEKFKEGAGPVDPTHPV